MDVVQILGAIQLSQALPEEQDSILITAMQQIKYAVYFVTNAILLLVMLMMTSKD
jgi:hypothetical protein